MSAITKIFGTHSERELKRIYPLVDKVESYREAMGALSDEELKNKTKEYKERLENGETLDDLLPEAYATVREAAKRVLGMEHYRVQIIGGIILHQGRIAEMKTGEGKTLVSTLPAYLNALEGKGVQIKSLYSTKAKLPVSAHIGNSFRTARFTRILHILSCQRRSWHNGK